MNTRFSNIAIEYLRENEKVCETVFACSYGAQIESFKQEKRMVENLSKSKLLKHKKGVPMGYNHKKRVKNFVTLSLFINRMYTL